MVEVIGGLWSGSLALLADAGHMATDSAALLFALAANIIARRPVSDRHSFGLARVEVIAAFVNAIAMLAVVAWIFFEAFDRISTPVPVKGLGVFAIALIGLPSTLSSHGSLSRDRENVNTRAAFIHVMGDLLGSVAAIAAGAIIYFGGPLMVDPLLSMLVGGLILRSTFGVLRETTLVLLDSVPEGVEYGRVGETLAKIPGVLSVHDLHVWAMVPGKSALSAHVLVDDIERWPVILHQARFILRRDFHIDHITLQPEWLRREPPARAVVMQADARESLNAARIRYRPSFFSSIIAPISTGWWTRYTVSAHVPRNISTRGGRCSSGASRPGTRQPARCQSVPSPTPASTGCQPREQRHVVLGARLLRDEADHVRRRRVERGVGVHQPRDEGDDGQCQIPRAQPHQRSRDQQRQRDEVKDAEPDEARSEHQPAAERHEGRGRRHLGPAPQEVAEARPERHAQHEAHADQQQELRHDRRAPPDPRLVARHRQRDPAEVVQVVDEVVDDHLRDGEAAQHIDQRKPRGTGRGHRRREGSDDGCYRAVRRLPRQEEIAARSSPVPWQHDGTIAVATSDRLPCAMRKVLPSIRRGAPMSRAWRLFAAAVAATLAVAPPATAIDLQGHRGARGLAPENTLAAFRKAIDIGVTTLETDLALTSDDVLVLSHDPALNRALTRTGDGRWLSADGAPIRSLTAAELRAYDVGRIDPSHEYAKSWAQQVAADGERIPTLAQLFALARDARSPGGRPVRFNIETKLTPVNAVPTASGRRVRTRRRARDAGRPRRPSA